MFNRPFQLFPGLRARAIRAAFAAALCGAAPALAAPLHVTIDTSGFGVAAGYLDLQLSASGGVPLAALELSNLSGFSAGAQDDAFGVASTATGYVFRNDTANDVFRAAAFGGTLSFDMDFTGAADPATSYVSHFLVSAFDSSYAPLGAYDPVNAALADFSWTPARDAFASGVVGVTLSDGAAVSVSAVSAVPEPAGAAMLGAGIGMLAWLGRRRTAAK